MMRTALTLGLMLLLAAPAMPQTAQRDDHVLRRMDAMRTAGAAMDRLGAMASGRALWSPAQAKADRRTLVAVMDGTPRLFRRYRMDVMTHAAVEIWTRWPVFKDRARTAETAARRLNVRSLARLRQGVPPLLDACLACHLEFRRQ